jgi:DNA-binding CsgD family transcriptional regulator/streptogramin lyase
MTKKVFIAVLVLFTVPLSIWPYTGQYIRFECLIPELQGETILGISSILQDKEDYMWFGTGRGLLKYDGYAFTSIPLVPSRKDSPSPVSIYPIFEDREGHLWIGTQGEGLFHFSEKTSHINQYLHDPDNPESLSDNIVLAIAEDRNGDLWIGTRYGGLNRLTRTEGTFNRIDLGTEIETVWDLFVDQTGFLWVGTDKKGLFRVNPETLKADNIRHDPSDPQSLLGNLIQTVFEDREGNFWVGIRGGGLDRMNKSTGKCQHYNYDTRTFTGNGLNSNTIMAVCEDKEGILWFGTLAGFSRYDILTDQWKNFTPKEGLSGNMVYGILEDRTGHLWLSTNQGISRFDPSDETFIPYFIHDGLQGEHFNPGSFYKAADGRMYFGGVNGYNSFNPEKIEPNPIISPIVWTGLYKNNQRVEFRQPLSSLDKLELAYKYSLITLEFALLHYANPLMNQFAYLLEGKDSGWNYLGPNNAVSFSELKTGEYTLHVKAANPDGVWNEEGLSIGIRIIPPFWKTGWFIFLAVLALTAFFYSFFRMRKQSKAVHLSFEKNLGTIFDKYKITAREQEIIRLILQGASNKDIEKKLFISNSTVRNHIYNIYQKLEVQNRLELIHMIRPSN